MPTPSLLIVPSRWKTGNPGKLYSQIPTNGNGDFNVTGVVTGAGNIGTRVNNLGYIERITTSGTPRLDYYTSSGTPGCPALLVEPSGTNLYQQSEDFSNVYWAKISCVASGNLTIAPDGNLTADKLIMGNGISPSIANQAGITRSETITSSAYRFSVFAKSAEFTGFRVRENLLNGTFLDVNLTNGAITNGDVTQFINPLAENYGNGWYRISWTSPTITNLNKYTIRVGSTGDGVSGIFIWGSQVETGSVPTSYIPTTTATGSRSADVISVSGAVSGSIGQASGTIYAEVDIRNAFAGTFISLDIGSGADFLIIGRTSGLAVIVQLRRSNGSVVTIITSSAVALGVHKIALGYTNGDYALYIDGVSAGTSTNSTDYPSAALTRCGLAVTSYNIFNDRIRAVALYTTRLTNADLMLLTMPGNNTYLPQAVWDNYLSRTGNAEVPDCLYTRHADLLDV